MRKRKFGRLDAEAAGFGVDAETSGATMAEDASAMNWRRSMCLPFAAKPGLFAGDKGTLWWLGVAMKHVCVVAWVYVCCWPVAE